MDKIENNMILVHSAPSKLAFVVDIAKKRCDEVKTFEKTSYAPARCTTI